VALTAVGGDRALKPNSSVRLANTAQRIFLQFGYVFFATRRIARVAVLVKTYSAASPTTHLQLELIEGDEMDFAPYSSDNDSANDSYNHSANDSATLAYHRPAARRKTRITIYLDDDVLEHFRALANRYGTGYQTLINAALRSRLSGVSGERGWFV
jgi:uncharacterized protein (DUF4415 family)